jgi:hypothetical protein
MCEQQEEHFCYFQWTKSYSQFFVSLSFTSLAHDSHAHSRFAWPYNVDIIFVRAALRIFFPLVLTFNRKKHTFTFSAVRSCSFVFDIDSFCVETTSALVAVNKKRAESRKKVALDSRIHSQRVSLPSQSRYSLRAIKSEILK